MLVEGGIVVYATDEELVRFMSYVEALPAGCWFWTGARSRGAGNRKWYGSFWWRGRTVRAHRFADEVLARRGPLPAGQHRDHTCCFSLCVRPDHIERVSHSENEARRVSRALLRRGGQVGSLTC